MKKISGPRKYLCIPYGIFLICFVALPLLVIIFYAFTNGQGQFSVKNFMDFFTSPYTMGTLCYSFGISVIVTAVCLLLAYPIAYILARSRMKYKTTIVFIFIMPMWINFTLRITALKEALTLIEHNLSYHPYINTVIGMVYDFLPFMILPIYTVLMNLDESLLEAAQDLGANGAKAFLKVTLPLSVPGIISGITMVFLPSMTNYVVLDMLYNSTYIMGSLIGAYFSAYDWNNGSLIALILLVIILIFTLCTNSLAEEQKDRGGVRD